MSCPLSVLSFTLSGKHIHVRPITLIVASLIVYLIYFIYYLLYHILCKFPILSCSYTVHILYTFISRILSYNLSYTILYFYLHSYNFHIRYSCILLYVFHLFLVFFIFQFYNLLHSMYYYIYHLLSCTYIISPFM